MPIATDSHTLPMGPMGPGFCGAECGEGPQLQLSHGPGKTSASNLGSLPAPRLSLGDAEGSHGVQTGLEAPPVGSSWSPSPRLLPEAQGQIKGTQH